MNGELVGQWSILATGVQRFAYDETWLDNPAGRSLSPGRFLPVVRRSFRPDRGRNREPGAKNAGRHRCGGRPAAKGFSGCGR
ncbi:MAG: hypothetical protein ACO1N5_10860 [Noviherbaspirillum sp.]